MGKMKAKSKRPTPSATGSARRIKILTGLDVPTGSQTVHAVVFSGWAVQPYIIKGRSTGFAVSCHGRSLNTLCADLEWFDAFRIAIRLAFDVPNPALEDMTERGSDARWIIASIVAEILGESGESSDDL